MNADFLFAHLKEVARNAIKTGATQALEDLAETFSADDLGKLIAIMQKVEKKKRGTIDAKGSPSTR
jgi:hypothetical protein